MLFFLSNTGINRIVIHTTQSFRKSLTAVWNENPALKTPVLTVWYWSNAGCASFTATKTGPVDLCCCRRTLDERRCAIVELPSTSHPQGCRQVKNVGGHMASADL